MTSATAAVEITAPAKLNLSLRCLGLRPDGFHELEALTVMIGAPADTLRFRTVGEGGVQLVVRGRGSGVPHGEHNLAVRAAHAIAPVGLGVQLELTKAIPVGAGLGGGSTDAAAVLRAARDSWGLDPAMVMTVAAGLGADVPVCVDGRPVVMRGRGERLDPVELRTDLHVVVVTPRFSLATPSVFGAWDELGGPGSHRVVPPPAAVAHVVDGLVNDLEPAAEHVDARLGPFRVDLERVLRRPVLLAGSGSSYWAEAADGAEALHLAARVHAELGVDAFGGPALRAAPRGVSVVGG